MNNSLSDFQSWKHDKDVGRRIFFSALSLATTSQHADPVQVVPVIKIDPDTLTEAEKLEILKKQKNEECEKKFISRLHEMNEQEKKNKDLAKKKLYENVAVVKKCKYFYVKNRL